MKKKTIFYQAPLLKLLMISAVFWRGFGKFQIGVMWLLLANFYVKNGHCIDLFNLKLPKLKHKAQDSNNK